MSSQNYEQLNILKIVSSSNHKEEKPEFAIDGSPDTKWSAKGRGESITLDLGSPQEVYSARIKWYEGDLRKMTYELYFSMDGQRFKRIGTCVSSGNANNEFEENVFERRVKCRYFKIIGLENTLNSFISIVDVKLFGIKSDIEVPFEEAKEVSVLDKIEENKDQDKLYPEETGLSEETGEIDKSKGKDIISKKRGKK